MSTIDTTLVWIRCLKNQDPSLAVDMLVKAVFLTDLETEFSVPNSANTSNLENGRFTKKNIFH